MLKSPQHTNVGIAVGESTKDHSTPLLLSPTMINVRCLEKSLKQDKHAAVLPQKSLPDSSLWLQLEARSLYLILNRFVLSSLSSSS